MFPEDVLKAIDDLPILLYDKNNIILSSSDEYLIRDLIRAELTKIMVQMMKGTGGNLW